MVRLLMKAERMFLGEGDAQRVPVSWDPGKTL